MRKTEERFWDLMIRHRLKIFIACATLLSMYARFSFRGFISPDMDIFLIPWYDVIQERGAWRALGQQVGNYQISYQTLVALLTYLPVHKVYAYKMLSIAFDYALGIVAGRMVREITGSQTKAAAVYAAVVLLPTTVLNSAAWGQCDSIYTFFLMATFLLLLRERHGAAFFCYGLAFAFKLQAVFFLPFLLFYYVWSRKFSAWQFLWIPAAMLLASVGGLIQGRSPLDIFRIYAEQGGTYQQISLNYPSFWNLMVVTLAEDGVDHYAELQGFCLGVTVVALGGIMLWLVRKGKLSKDSLLQAATLMMYTCLFFLPAMHERYSYPVLIFLTAACALSPRMIPVLIGVVAIDLQTYGFYLMKKEVLSWDLLTLMNVACYAGTLYLTWRSIQREPVGRIGKEG
ncbi:MAG: DUF2029 domain-containing protein [Clostridia bacterium]|nr:DUF2029 domain-containing protein [Clostridia bacterium]